MHLVLTRGLPGHRPAHAAPGRRLDRDISRDLRFIEKVDDITARRGELQVVAARCKDAQFGGARSRTAEGR